VLKRPEREDFCASFCDVDCDATQLENADLQTAMMIDDPYLRVAKLLIARIFIIVRGV
jgi:hypothetical protein